MSAADAGDKTSKEVDEKFERVISLLSGFKKDFPFWPFMLDSNIDGMITWEVEMSDDSKSPLGLSNFPLTILYALEKNLHSKVKLFYSFISQW